jgi:hypothetical protein
MAVEFPWLGAPFAFRRTPILVSEYAPMYREKHSAEE